MSASSFRSLLFLSLALGCGADADASCKDPACQSHVQSYADEHVSHMAATAFANDAAVELLQQKATSISEDEDDSELAVVRDDSPDEQKTCEAFDKANPGLVKVDFTMAKNTVNNLGGFGPQKALAKQLYYKNVGKDDDVVYDMKITVIGDGYQPKAPQYNGENGYYGVVNVKCGTSVDLEYTFLDSQTGQPRKIGNLVFSWFDLDKGKVGGGVESVVLWPGFESTVVSPSSEIITDGIPCPEGAEADLCRSFQASQEGTGKDNPRDPMQLTAQQAARTFSVFYKDKSSFRVTLKASEGFGSRNFLFSGMSQVAYTRVQECCPKHLCGCPEICSKNEEKTWGEKCLLGQCSACEQCQTTTTTTTQGPASKEETCQEALTFELSTDNLVENTLGVKSPGVGKLFFKNVAAHAGKSLDLTVTDASATPQYRNSEYSRFKADSREYTGVYKEAGRIAFDEPGKYILRFKFTVDGEEEAARLPLFPVTFYDVDGKGETLSACHVAAVITHFKTGLVERQDGQCYHHLAMKKEVNIPTDFEHLTPNQAQQAVTYVYRNKGEWDIAIKLNEKEDERYILFKSSKVLACEGNVKERKKDWESNGKKGDA